MGEVKIGSSSSSSFAQVLAAMQTAAVEEGHWPCGKWSFCNYILWITKRRAYDRDGIKRKRRQEYEDEDIVSMLTTSH